MRQDPAVARTQAPRRGTAVGLCLLTCGLLVLLAVRHAQAVESLAPMSFGMETSDVLVFALLVALLASAAALLVRAHRQGLSVRTLKAQGAAAVLLVAAVLTIGSPRAVYEAQGGLGNAYSSQLFLDFSPVMPWLVGAVVVAALGLLPVAAAAVVFTAADRVPLTRRKRAVALAACAVAALLLLAALEREAALLGVVRGEAQQLSRANAVVWVAGLWALMAAGWSAGALRHAGRSIARLALVVPLALLLGSALLVLGQDGRHECCFAYAPVQGAFPDAVVEPGVADVYRPPPLTPDLLLLAGCLVVGVGPPLGLGAVQRLRVRTSASTPPG